MLPGGVGVTSRPPGRRVRDGEEEGDVVGQGVEGQAGPVGDEEGRG